MNNVALVGSLAYIAVHSVRQVMTLHTISMQKHGKRKLQRFDHELSYIC